MDDQFYSLRRRLKVVEEIKLYTYQKHDPAIETEQQWWDRTRMWKSAYHETGHAWIATRCGWAIKMVTLDPKVHGSLTGSGLTETYIPHLAPMLAVLMNYRAGKVCERLVLPRWLWSIWMMGGGMGDDSDATEYLKHAHGITSSSQQEKLLREAEAEVKILVGDPVHRNEIDRLAEALMESPTLTGDQVRAIIKSHDHSQ